MVKVSYQLILLIFLLILHIEKIRQSGYDSGKIKIENNVWIGSNCIIMKNVTIEEGSVIESGSVVKKSVGKNEFVTSNEQTNKKY